LKLLSCSTRIDKVNVEVWHLADLFEYSSGCSKVKINTLPFTDAQKENSMVENEGGGKDRKLIS